MWAPPLPGNIHVVGLMRFDQLPDILLLYLGCHSEVTAGVEISLIQEKTVCAIQVASSPGRFYQQVKSQRCVLRPFG